MLTRVDRMQLAVRDREVATKTLQAILGAERVGEDRIDLYQARRTTLQAGESEFELLEPAGPGVVAEHLEQRGEGIFAAGFSAPDMTALAAHLTDAGAQFAEEHEQLFLDPLQTKGMRVVLSQHRPRQALGVVSFLYEVTNIVADHKEAAGFYADLLGLDATRFSPIHSNEYGYDGTLTLFNPPERLDRIELTQTDDPDFTMGRFYRKHGESVYMCYMETPDVGEVARRIEAGGRKWVGRREKGGLNGLFIPPASLHGVLMGISRTNYAWNWSGHPELAGAAASS